MKLEIDIDEDYYKIICKRVEKNKPYHSPYEYEVIADGKPLEEEPQSFKWCTDCKEYDQEKHCCHRYSKVIRDAVAEIRQEPKFIAKSDGTIEQIKNCNDCLFKNEWEKIGKLLSVFLEKQTEQEPKTGEWIEQNDDYYDWYECSECGYGSEGEMLYSSEYDVRTNYCPNCGAKMVEPQESENV